jgi:hypothetical protein
MYARATNVDQVAAHCVGTLAAMLDRFDEAEDHFALAVAHHRRLRAPLLLAETLVERARSQRRGGTLREQTERWLREARRLARAHSADGLTNLADTVI